MNKLIAFAAIASLLLGCLSGCADREKKNVRTKSPRIKKKLFLSKPVKNSTVRFGQAVPLEVSVKSGEAVTVDSISIEGLDEKKTLLSSGGNWMPEHVRAGSPELKLSAYYDGKTETFYPKVKFIPDKLPKEYVYQMMNRYPHDDKAYTQGLLFFNGYLYESTGQRGASGLRKIRLPGGDIEQQINLGDEYFGEGIAVYQNEIYQLTWTSRVAFVYDMAFEKLRTLSYRTEGWGITNFGQHLIMSDGTENLYVIDPADFSEVDKIQVYSNEGKVDNLNELEMVNGQLYANVYGEDYVVMIDPQTGAVEGKADLSGLRDPATAGKGIDYVLNGIAYDSISNRLFVTGKLWPFIFEVSLKQQPSILWSHATAGLSNGMAKARNHPNHD